MKISVYRWYGNDLKATKIVFNTDIKNFPTSHLTDATVIGFTSIVLTIAFAYFTTPANA